MSSRSLLAAIDSAFDHIATESEGAEEKVLQEPGFELLASLLEGCLDEVPDSGVSADAVSVTSVKKVFQEKAWPDDMSFTRDDLDTLFQSLCLPEAEEEGMAEDFPDVEDPKQERSVTMAFPLVRPTELSGKDEQMAAEQSLKLVEKLNAVKLQSYLDEKFKEYLKNSPPRSVDFSEAETSALGTVNLLQSCTGFRGQGLSR